MQRMGKTFVVVDCYVVGKKTIQIVFYAFTSLTGVRQLWDIFSSEYSTTNFNANETIDITALRNGSNGKSIRWISMHYPTVWLDESNMDTQVVYSTTFLVDQRDTR